MFAFNHFVVSVNTASTTYCMVTVDLATGDSLTNRKFG